MTRPRSLRQLLNRPSAFFNARPANPDDSAAIGSDPAPDPGPSDPVPGVETISTLDQLDEKLREVNEAWAVSDDKMREVFAGFRMAPPTDLPRDPYGAEYRERQFELYRVISGRDSYDIDNEESNFPVDPNRPFPYYTESPHTVGHHLMALGVIVQTMDLAPKSTILELGAGWGNTTIALARMGYELTAIDIDPNFVGLIGARAEKLSLSIDVRRSGFLDVDQLGRVFDAVLFFESFHHCSDHLSLFSKLENVLAPEGRVFFAAEPINDGFPVPWGIRLDGESLWAIRANGWLELGFQESYFIRALLRLGWLVRKHVNPGTHLGVIFEAWRANNCYPMSTFSLPPDEDATWGVPDSDAGPGQRFSARHSRITLEHGKAYGTVSIAAKNFSPRELPYSVEHGRNRVEGNAKPHSDLTISVPYDPDAAELVIECATWRPSELLGTEDPREIALGISSITLTSP
jgi:SAM-dependent methyltransferase